MAIGMRDSMRRKAARAALVAMIVAAPIATVGAVSLEEAKARGLVGERLDGYLGIVAASTSPEVKALVDDINRRRRAEYQEIAARNKTNVQAVEALAGQKAIEKTVSGRYIQRPSGEWARKP